MHNLSGQVNNSISQVSTAGYNWVYLNVMKMDDEIAHFLNRIWQVVIDFQTLDSAKVSGKARLQEVGWRAPDATNGLLLPIGNEGRNIFTFCTTIFEYHPAFVTNTTL